MRTAKNGFTLIELAIVISIFVAMVLVLTPFVQMAKARARRVACENNLRKISIALHVYASRNNDAFPASLGALYPDYLEDKKAFDCPSSATAGTPANPDYMYLPGMTEASPPREVIVKDMDGNHRAGANILRVNGSIDWLEKKRREGAVAKR